MKTILYIGLVQSIFAGLLVLSQEKKARHHIVLGVWLFIIAFQFFSELLFRYDINLFLKNYHLIIYPFLQGPFIYLYTVFTIYGEKKFSKVHLYHILPFVVISMIFFVFKGETLFEPTLMEQKNREIPFVETLYGISIYVINIFYAVKTHLLLKRNRNQIKNVFSNESNKTKLTWIQLIVYLSILFIISFYVLASFNHMVIQKDFDYSYILNIGLTLIVFIISFYGFRQPYVFHATTAIDNKLKAEKSNKAERYKRSGLKPEQAKKYIDNINVFMAEEKPFLDTEFSIYVLSETLSISQYYITQSLNEYLGKNFYTYVNEFRVEEVKKRLLDSKNDHLTVLGVGFECGFNSKSSFYSIFKKNTGMSPSEFKKRAVIKEVTAEAG